MAGSFTTVNAFCHQLLDSVRKHLYQESASQPNFISLTEIFFLLDTTVPDNDVTDRFLARITVGPLSSKVKTTLSCGPRFIFF